MRSFEAMDREQRMVQEYGLDGLVDLRMCGERGVAKGCKWDDTLKRCLCPGYSKAPDDEVSIPTPVNPPGENVPEPIQDVVENPSNENITVMNAPNIEATTKKQKSNNGRKLKRVNANGIEQYGTNTGTKAIFIG